MSAEEKPKKAHCNRCGHETNHELVGAHRTAGSEVYDKELGIVIDWWDLYEMLQCAGCDSVITRHTSYFSEWDGVKVVQYPPKIARRRPSWVEEPNLNISDTISGLLEEIYVALQNDQPRLAGMGVRALLEHIMIEQVGDQGSFGDNVNEFERSGFLAKHDRRSLEPILEAGHATMHRAWKPSAHDLSTVVDVTEALIAKIYVHPQKVATLSKKIPPHKNKKQKAAPAAGPD